MGSFLMVVLVEEVVVVAEAMLMLLMIAIDIFCCYDDVGSSSWYSGALIKNKMKAFFIQKEKNYSLRIFMTASMCVSVCVEFDLIIENNIIIERTRVDKAKAYVSFSTVP